MCRIVDYIMQEWEESCRSPRMVCLDTTGPFVKWREPFYFSRALFALAVAGARGHIAALHIHAAERGSVLRKGMLVQFARLIRRPSILHMHGASFIEFYEGMPASVRRLITYQFRKADRFVVLGTAWHRYFVERVGLDPERVLVLHNAVPDPGKPTSPPARDHCRLLFAGALIERKGLADLFAALARLKDLKWHLEVAGNGTVGPWQQLAAESGLADRITFAGWIESTEVHRRLDACDALVLPSHNEGLPMVILEAMAHGRPVIATDVGSVVDAVQHDRTGLVVPPRDRNALAAALRRLIGDADLRRSFGSAARGLYEQQFTIDRLSGGLARVFDEVLHGEATVSRREYHCSGATSQRTA